MRKQCSLDSVFKVVFMVIFINSSYQLCKKIRDLGNAAAVNIETCI